MRLYGFVIELQMSIRYSTNAKLLSTSAGVLISENFKMRTSSALASSLQCRTHWEAVDRTYSHRKWSIKLLHRRYTCLDTADENAAFIGIKERADGERALEKGRRSTPGRPLQKGYPKRCVMSIRPSRDDISPHGLNRYGRF